MPGPQNIRRPTDLSKNLPRISFLNAVTLAIIFILGYISLTFLLRSDIPLRLELTDLIYPIVNGLTACIWFYAALQSEAKSRVRMAWTFLAIAQLSFTLGDVIWAVLELYLFQSPFPSMADVFYLMYYPLFVAGVLFFPVQPMKFSESLKLLIDTGIIIISASLVSWIFVIGPTIITNKDDTLVLALSLAYPVMDLLLLFVLLALLFRQVSSIDRVTLMLLFFGGIAEIIYDFTYSVMELQGSYVSGDPIDILGVSGYALFILAGISYVNAGKLDLSKPLLSSGSPSYQFSWLFYMPYLSAGIAYLMLIWSRSISQMRPFTYLMEVGVGIIIGLVFIRQIITHKENTSLYAKAQQEISERIHAEGALKESEHRLADIIDFLPDATFVIDSKKTVIAWNRAMEEMTGVSRDNLIGQGDLAYTIPFYGDRRRHLLDLIDMDDKDLDSKYEYVQKKGNTLYAETYAPALNGGKGAYVWATGAPVFDNNGNRIGAIESIRDITERKRAERTLQEQLNFLQQLIDAIPSPIFYKSTKGVYHGCNKAFEAITGRTSDMIVGYTVYELYPKDLADIYSEADRKLFKNPGVQVYEAAIAPADGSRRDVMFSKATYFDTEGNLDGLVGVILDITERKNMENALRESERRLADIINFLPDAALVIDKEGKVIAWNRAIEALTGFKAEDMLGKGSYEHALPFYGQRRPILIDLVLRPEGDIEKEYSNLQRDGDTLVGESYIPMLGGKEAYIWGIASALYDSQGNIVGAIESIKDITERMHAEEELARQNALLKSIIESPENIISFSLDCNYRYISFNELHRQTMKTIWGVDIRLGMKMLDIIAYPEDREMARCNFDKVLSGEYFTEMEEYGDTELSRKYWEDIYSPILDENARVIGINVLCMDITERRLAEEKLVASLQEKDLLLKEVHHRVKNNLQIVSSLLRLQSRKIQDEEIADVFMDSQNRIKSMALVHEKLYRSKDLSKVYLNEYINKLVRDLIRSFECGKRVRFHSDLEEAFLGIDKAIPFGLILNELITNCLKHAFPEARSGEVYVDLKSDGHRLTLAVRDNGIGIPEDLDIGKPSSMGLILVQSLVNQLKGTLEVKINGGTEFKLSIDM